MSILTRQRIIIKHNNKRTNLERWLLEAPAPYRTFFDIIDANGRIISLRSRFGIILARKSSR